MCKYSQATVDAMTICDQVGKKPTPAAAKVLKKLFPSSTSTPVQKRPFDPTADCIVSTVKKKKKAVRSRCTTVRFILLKDFEKGLPRGQARKQLLEGNCSKKIEIFRTMNAAQVRAKILQGFPNASAISFLQLNGGINMTISSNQNLDGDGVITASAKRNGNVVYITDCSPVY